MEYQHFENQTTFDNYIEYLKYTLDFYEHNTENFENVDFVKKRIEHLTNEISVMECKQRIKKSLPKRRLPIIKHYDYLMQFR